jgi:transposase
MLTIHDLALSQDRRFAEAIGKLAKTDRLDAAMLARMGA